VYNPVSAILQERSKRFEAELFGQTANALSRSGGTFWVSQRTDEGQAIINAVASRDQGINLNGVSIFIFDTDGRFKQRIEARAAVLIPGAWVLRDARVYGLGQVPIDQAEYRLKTSLTPEQVRESFATPETVPFWELPGYIQIAEHAGLVAAGYRLQFQKLLARPFLLAAMVLLAAAKTTRENAELITQTALQRGLTEKVITMNASIQKLRERVELAEKGLSEFSVSAD